MDSMRVGLAGVQAVAKESIEETKARHRRFFRNRLARRDVIRNGRRDDQDGKGVGGVDTPTDTDDTGDEFKKQPTPVATPQPKPTSLTIEKTAAPAAVPQPQETNSPAPQPQAEPTPTTSPSQEPPSASPTEPAEPIITTPVALSTVQNTDPPSPTSTSFTALPAVSTAESSTTENPPAPSTFNTNPPLSTIPLPTQSPSTTKSRKATPTTSTDPLPLSTSTIALTTTSAPARVSAIPDLETSTKRAGIVTVTTTPASSVALTNSAALSVATGVGSAMVTSKSAFQPVSGGLVAGVVIGILATAIVIIAITYFIVKGRRAKSKSVLGDEEKSSGGAHAGFANVWKTKVNETRLWGTGSSTGAPTEAGDPYIPPLRQRDGPNDNTLYDNSIPSSTAGYESRVPTYAAPQPFPTQLSPPPAPKPGPRVNAAGLIQPPNRWFGRESIVSNVSVPRFRTVKSWVRDQGTRVEEKTSRWSRSDSSSKTENRVSKWSESGSSDQSSDRSSIPPMPTGPYEKMGN